MTHIDRRNVVLGLGAVSATGILAPTLSTVALAESEKSVYQWGSASLGSTAYEIITTLASAASKFTDRRHAALSTAGGSENMALIGQGVLDFANSTTTDWQPAINGTGRYEGNPVKAVQALSYMVWQTTPIVHAGSDIKTLDDLKGKRLMPGPSGGATFGLWETFFKAAGLYDDVEWTFGSWKETYDAMASGAVDCVPTILVGGTPSGVLQRLETNTKVRVLDITQEQVDQATDMNPGVLSAMVTPETWSTVDEPKLMLGLAGVLALRPTIPEEIVYEVVKAIYENAEFIRDRGGPNLKLINHDFATKFLMPAYPVHAGAAKYFREAGIWRDDLTVAG